MQTTFTLHQLTSFTEHAANFSKGNKPDIIYLNNKKLLGYIKRTAFEEGFYMLRTDIRILQDCLLNTWAENDICKPYFVFVYFTEEVAPDMIRIQTNKKHCVGRPSVFISNGKEDVVFFKAGTTTRLRIFLFSQQWIKTQMIKLENSSFTTLSKVECLLLKSLAKHEQEHNLLRTRLTALSLFLCSLENRDSPQIKSQPGHEGYKEILQAVEKKILENLYSTMPPTHEIAKEFYMSVSTLKRQFKRVFGSNMYEYYLTHKMQLAKNMLENQHLKVFEVAAQLHYENVSHFIRLFKKFHGILPGRVLNGRKLNAEKED
ncbi:MAG: helix-turn-helix transcriptional regulator [Flavisolibacter sp.]